MAKKSLKNSKIYIKDAGSNEVEIIVGDGNVTWTEGRTLEVTPNRGKISPSDGGTVTEGDDVPMEVSLDFTFTYYYSSGSEAVTPIEAIKGINNASDWETTDTVDPCAPYSVNIVIDYDPGTCGGVSNPREVITLPRFRWTSGDFDMDAGSGTFQGQCGATAPSITRGASII